MDIQETKSWDKPIICTSHVQFLETIASNMPMKIAKMHNIADSVIVVDEFHLINASFTPLLIAWFSNLVKNYGCKIILVSATPNHIWETNAFKKAWSDDFQKIYGDIPTFQNLVSEEVQETLMASDSKRLKYDYQIGPKKLCEIVEMISSKKGSRLVVMNTTRGAAELAFNLSSTLGKEKVFHVSTALTPKDRSETVQKVLDLLKDPESDFILVGTSCVEIGIDFSFRYGFREFNGLPEIIQNAGRINRNWEYADSSIIIFETCPKEINQHPSFGKSIIAMKKYLKKNPNPGPIDSKDYYNDLYCYGNLPDIIHTEDDCISVQQLVEFESSFQFEKVEKYFKLINEESIGVLCDKSILSQNPSRQEIQLNSFSVAPKQVESMPIEEVEVDGQTILVWRGRYDNFIGRYAEEF